MLYVQPLTYGTFSCMHQDLSFVCLPSSIQFRQDGAVWGPVIAHSHGQRTDALLSLVDGGAAALGTGEGVPEGQGCTTEAEGH